MNTLPNQPGFTPPSLTPEIIDLSDLSPINTNVQDLTARTPKRPLDDLPDVSFKSEGERLPEVFVEKPLENLAELPPKRPLEELSVLERAKRFKPATTETPVNTPPPSDEVKQPTKKDLEKLERQKKRDEDKLEKERQKEEDRRLKEEERRRKLEQKEAEKEMRRRRIEEEKLEKERKKEEEKLEKERKKEEEKLEKERKKEEDRLEKERKKEEERLEKEKKKEEERLKKEEKKRKADEEKKKKVDEAKDRSQMKISSFFLVKQPKTASSPQKQAKEPVSSNLPLSAITANNDTHAEGSASLYSKTFLPFFQKQNVVLAPSVTLSEEDLAQSKNAFDAILNGKHVPLDISQLRASFAFTSVPSRRSYNTPQQIIETMNSSEATEEQILSMFQNMPPVKYLQFYENAKPPYIGTWCSEAHKSIVLPTENPFERSMTGFDYDYDSDLDWDGEDEDGEDIEDDDEEEEDEPMEDDGEMEDFVESNDVTKKNKKFLGPLVAVCQWNGGAEKGAGVFDDIKYERLDVSIQYSIDPHFDYWGPSKVLSETKDATVGQTPSSVSPLRTPAGATPHILTPQRPVIKDTQTLYELIKFVEKNNDFTIGTLVELSKKEFKAFTKAVLKHTIQEIACYNKKTNNWEVKEPLKKKLLGELGILA